MPELAPAFGQFHFASAFALPAHHALDLCTGDFGSRYCHLLCSLPVLLIFAAAPGYCADWSGLQSQSNAVIRQEVHWPPAL